MPEVWGDKVRLRGGDRVHTMTTKTPTKRRGIVDWINEAVSENKIARAEVEREVAAKREAANKNNLLTLKRPGWIWARSWYAGMVDFSDIKDAERSLKLWQWENECHGILDVELKLATYNAEVHEDGEITAISVREPVLISQFLGETIVRRGAPETGIEVEERAKDYVGALMVPRDVSHAVALLEIARSALEKISQGEPSPIRLANFTLMVMTKECLRL